MKEEKRNTIFPFFLSIQHANMDYKQYMKNYKIEKKIKSIIVNNYAIHFSSVKYVQTNKQ